MITPRDLEMKEFKKAPYGYSTKEVDVFIQTLLRDYETIYKENIELKDKITMLNDGLKYYKTMEETLKQTLIIAEKTAEDTKKTASDKAEQIESEAKLKAIRIVEEANQQAFELKQKIKILSEQFEASKIQIKSFYNTQVELIDKHKYDFKIDKETNLITNEDGMI